MSIEGNENLPSFLNPLNKNSKSFQTNVHIVKYNHIERGKTMDIKNYIASIPGFPKEGIVFRDVTPILQNPKAMHYVTDEFSKIAKEVGADFIVGPEARGFLFGVPVAMQCDLGFAPVRKPGKLPREVISQDYDLEYGKDTLCMHTDAVQPGQKVLIIDDLLATGGTTAATIKLLEKMGAEVVGCAFIIELDDLKGKDLLGNIPVYALAHYEGE